MGEAEVILGIRIRKGNNGISISQSHYIEKILKKFNFENCSPVSTPIDPSLELLPNKGSPVSQLKYSRAIGCLVYAMISTRPDIAYAVGRLSRYTSNPSSHHWQAVSRVFKYLKGTMNYGLTYIGYPSVSERITPLQVVGCFFLEEVLFLGHPRNRLVLLTQPWNLSLFNCIFIGYADHSKAYRFYVLESNDSVSVNTVIESRDAIFDEERFTSIPRPRDMIHQSSSKSATQAEDVSGGASSVPEPRNSTRARKAKSFGSDFQLYLVEGTRSETISQHQYCFNIEEDPKTFSEAMASRDVHFWKEAIHDEIDSVMHNNTWALGCKWILKRKMKVDGTIDKYKARLVIQGFRQKEGIDFFDTYAPVARISIIRLLLALAAIHNLVIHQMDVKTAFLNGDLDEEIYMKQPEGFVMPGNEHKVCKLKKSLYGLKQAPKQWHQNFDDVVLSNGFALNHADKCVYSKFDTFGKGVMICLYVDDMLIFGTDLEEVDKTKKFLSSSFDMKDMGDSEVILGIRIRKGNNGISISQSHYIEKILKKFNFENCSSVSTPIDPSLKLLPNKGSPVSQLEYSRAIGCLMYAMISTRPDIAYAVGRLSRYTSNPSSHHWQAVSRVFKYLKGTMNYGLTYIGYPSVSEVIQMPTGLTT
uniref:Reverse transcriptase Ty1/copia-type domain-containing protein n=1 Tax=Lactuca sativa TaxID=4236 RepID=A0A9R1WQ62_LACSA|nr:hypothetical protein LSAT_V11C100011740 [Lactuca sativa]